MGFQFVHIETYARKADRHGRAVAWVLDEAERREGACPHVVSPQPPQVIHGMALGEVRQVHDEVAAAHVVVLKNGRTRALRSDQKTLVTVVASHPARIEDVRANATVAADVTAWEARTVAWLVGQYGDRLLSVVRHTDEAHAHVHAYILPSDMRASHLHPGAEAKRLVVEAGPREGEDAKTLNRRGDAAYKRALREWQDSYWQHVGLPSGLARLGPARRRLTRAEWHAEQVVCQAAKEATDRAADIDRRAAAHIVKTRGAAAALVADAKATARANIAAARSQADEARRLHDVARRQHRKVRLLERAARSQARLVVAMAQAEGDRLRAFGGRLRSIWDGLRFSAIRAALRQEVAAEIDHLTAALKRAAGRLREEAERRREAERRAADVAQSAGVVGRDRDRLRRELDTLRPDPVADPGPKLTPRRIGL